MYKMRLAFIAILPLVSLLILPAQAGMITRMDGGMTSVYWQVPDNLDCNIRLPDKPNAFCKGADNTIYYQTFLGTVQGVADPDQLVSYIIQNIISQQKIDIVKKYTVPQVTRHLLQQNSVFIHTQGQRMYTYAIDVNNDDMKEVGTFLFVVAQVPNNGTPVTNISLYGVSLPSSQIDNFKAIREQFFSALLSTRYDNNYVQAVNAAQTRFLNNLRARENTFYTNQNQIHKNNMNALDQQFQNYRQSSAASDRMQEQTINGINETRRMVDPQTGQQYQVDGYSENVWVNPNDSGMSVQTDNSLVNPNINNEQGLNFNRLEEYKY